MWESFQLQPKRVIAFRFLQLCAKKQNIQHEQFLEQVGVAVPMEREPSNTVFACVRTFQRTPS